MSATVLPNPTRYFEAVDQTAARPAPPVCLYLEVTNRCNLLCETCPRTFEALEPPADMSWELFTRIVDQAHGLKRAVLHGVGEPMLVPELPRMIRYLKDRGVYVLFNTNGTLLREKRFAALIDSGLDELRVSLDAADAASYTAVRGRPFFDRIVRDVRNLREYQERAGATHPKISLWLTGLKETIQQLPDFVRLAASMHVREVHLQRLVFDEAGFGMASAEHSLFEQTDAEEMRAIESWRAARCVGCQRADGQPEAAGRKTLVGLQAALEPDVFYRPWPCAAVLHRAVFRTRLRNLHAGRCQNPEPRRDVERPGLHRFPRETGR
jgi:MoaA/NifB/PqqE/SkfB family radical SAM enzyme